MKNTIYYLVVLLCLPFILNAQDTLEIKKAPDYIQDGAFTKDHNVNKVSSYDYPEIIEKDIVWSRTIWREIDLRQKINHHFYYPAIQKRKNLDPENMCLADVIFEALEQNAKEQITNNGGANVMSNTGEHQRLECFKTGMIKIPGKEFDWGIMTPQEILSVGTEKSEMEILTKEDGSGEDSLDINGNEVYYETEVTPFDRTIITKWKIKEEIFFDKKRSVMDTRIVGLCPVAENYKEPVSGKIIPQYELFWIYFPDFRTVLARSKVLNLTKNDAQKRSYLDIFEKRMFSSRIIMESNIMNREISDYMIGLDALLEADRIQEEIFNIEHDLWEY